MFEGSKHFSAKEITGGGRKKTHKRRWNLGSFQWEFNDKQDKLVLCLELKS